VIHTVRFSDHLQGVNVWRGCVIHREPMRVHVELTVQLGEARHVCMAWCAFVFDRETPAERATPAIVRADESTWRVEAWDWRGRYPTLPPGLGFLLAGAPEGWP
jgi:hypothetical protein